MSPARVLATLGVAALIGSACGGADGGDGAATDPTDAPGRPALEVVGDDVVVASARPICSSPPVADGVELVSVCDSTHGVIAEVDPGAVGDSAGAWASIEVVEYRDADSGAAWVTRPEVGVITLSARTAPGGPARLVDMLVEAGAAGAPELCREAVDRIDRIAGARLEWSPDDLCATGDAAAELVATDPAGAVWMLAEAYPSGAAGDWLISIAALVELQRLIPPAELSIGGPSCTVTGTSASCSTSVGTGGVLELGLGRFDEGWIITSVDLTGAPARGDATDGAGPQTGEPGDSTVGTPCPDGSGPPERVCIVGSTVSMRTGITDATTEVPDGFVVEGWYEEQWYFFAAVSLDDGTPAELLLITGAVVEPSEAIALCQAFLVAFPTVSSTCAVTAPTGVTVTPAEEPVVAWDGVWREAPTGTLVQLGQYGPTVEILQEQLVLRGYPVDVDGYFGTETEAAVRQFQRDRGLPVTGVATPDVWQQFGE